MNKLRQGGFTLIELLIVIGIIAILAAVVLVALNPGRNFSQANNVTRKTDIIEILNKVVEFQANNRGALPGPGTISGTATEICKTGAPACTGLIDLSDLTESGTYMNEMPMDPACPDDCDANGTGYFIKQETNNRITVSAPSAELDEVIEETR